MSPYCQHLSVVYIFNKESIYIFNCIGLYHFWMSLFSRKLSDIFRKGRKQFRKSLSRGRSEEEGPKPQPLPTPVELPVISIPTRAEPKMTVAGSPADEALCSGTTKEQVQEWIQRQATAFLQQWCSQQYVVQEAMRKLEESSKQLEVTSPSGSAALHVRMPCCLSACLPS